jgi:cell surface protein SprA
LPVVTSGVNIERIEVWVTNKTSRFEEASNRNIVAFMDLAENSSNIYNKVPSFQQSGGGSAPSNDVNNLYNELTGNYSAIRNVDQVTNAFSSHYPGFQIGRVFEKI